VNAGLEKMRQDLGGYFLSQKSMGVNLFITIQQSERYVDEEANAGDKG